MEEVFQKLQATGLKLKLNNCEVLRRKVKYLRQEVSQQGVATDLEKVESVRDWRVPTHFR